MDVTGAWTVTITRSSGETATGLAILSQDGSKIAGMIGPAETEMMPAEGVVLQVDGNKVTVLTRPRTGRTAAFAKAELTATTEKDERARLSTDKGAIELIRKQRPKPKSASQVINPSSPAFRCIEAHPLRVGPFPRALHADSYAMLSKFCMPVVHPLPKGRMNDRDYEKLLAQVMRLERGWLHFYCNPGGNLIVAADPPGKQAQQTGKV